MLFTNWELSIATTANLTVNGPQPKLFPGLCTVRAERESSDELGRTLKTRLDLSV